MKIMKEFREFAIKGNVVDMAVGIIIGGAFTTIVQSLVSDVLMPPLGLLLSDVDFTQLYVVLRGGATPGPYTNLAAAQKAGAVTLNYGAFVSHLVSFMIVAIAVFLLVKGINAIRRLEEAAPAPVPAERSCPFCCTSIPPAARRCPHCTSMLDETG